MLRVKDVARIELRRAELTTGSAASTAKPRAAWRCISCPDRTRSQTARLRAPSSLDELKKRFPSGPAPRMTLDTTKVVTGGHEGDHATPCSKRWALWC